MLEYLHREFNPSDDHLIICGDFNCDHDSSSLEYLTHKKEPEILVCDTRYSEEMVKLKKVFKAKLDIFPPIPLENAYTYYGKATKTSLKTP